MIDFSQLTFTVEPDGRGAFIVKTGIRLEAQVRVDKTYSQHKADIQDHLRALIWKAAYGEFSTPLAELKHLIDTSLAFERMLKAESLFKQLEPLLAPPRPPKKP